MITKYGHWGQEYGVMIAKYGHGSIKMEILVFAKYGHEEDVVHDMEWLVVIHVHEAHTHTHTQVQKRENKSQKRQ